MFRIYLPVASVAAENTDRSRTGGIDDRLRGTETILVAEDEPSVRKLAVRSLRRAGYQVFEATTGREAVDVFSEHADKIDLVVLDVMMPEMTGRQAYERMKAIRPDLRAVLCTAYDPTAGEADFAGQWGLQLLQKPFRSEQLLKTIRESLDGSWEQPHEETFADALA
ncbi:MAG TPA: response regulator [Planctomycetaceae bacterium]|nr:response regulator [Planctomycetaceae bacterium]